MFLFRHGSAIERDDRECPPEPERFLTKEGKQRTRAAARGMARLGFEIDAVLSSPYLRARETAEIAMSALGVELQLRITRALLPEAEPAALRHELLRLGATGVLCVGHAPHLDRFAAYLVGSPVPVTALKKAGLAHLEATDLKNARAILVDVLTNKTLRRLA